MDDVSAAAEASRLSVEEAARNIAAGLRQDRRSCAAADQAARETLGNGRAKEQPGAMMKQDVQQKHAQTIADYVGDMVALESHIEEALDRQLAETQEDPEAHAAAQRFHDMVKQHRDTLKGLQEHVGTTAGNPIIEAGATLLGKAAGVIDLVRTEGISKSLRDDYAAFSLAAISYSMLHTTALGLGNSQVAELAARHLTDYAGAIEQINEVMPGVVERELAKDGHQTDKTAVGATRTAVAKAWSSAAR
jgi:ferritin-like metal-binding protein YciE